MKLTDAIKQAGYGLSGDIGGLPRTTYYTPDGRAIKAFPDTREFVKRQGGKVVGTGTRDANLDKGWLLSPPLELKQFCPTCDRWHDTKAEISACKRNQTRLVAQMTLKVKREETDKTLDLEQQVARLTALVEKLMEGKNGGILQSTTNEPIQISPKQRVGKAKKGI